MSFGTKEHGEIKFIVEYSFEEATEKTNAFLKENQDKGWTVVNFQKFTLQDTGFGRMAVGVILARR